MIDFFSRKKKRRRRIRFIILLLVLIAVGIYFWYNQGVARPVGSDNEAKQFIVEAGWGSTEIAEALERANFIKSDLLFKLYTWREGFSSKLQSGEYFFDSDLSIEQIADILKRGAGVTKERTITLIEGWSIPEIAAYLDEQGVVDEQEFMAMVQKKAVWWDDFSLLDSRPRTVDLEGYLFPDTYRIFRDATAQDIIQKMLGTLESKITPEMRDEIERQGKTIHEILTLASILEREVRTPEDRKKVADIFYSRLKVGIALQADSTVNYATGKNLPAVTIEDLKIDSPYNTYKYRGLPPGPIANPSLSSIEAAIFPTSNNYFYFLTTPEGEVIYNETFEGHVVDKNKYY